MSLSASSFFSDYIKYFLEKHQSPKQEVLKSSENPSSASNMPKKNTGERASSSDRRSEGTAFCVDSDASLGDTDAQIYTPGTVRWGDSSKNFEQVYTDSAFKNGILEYYCQGNNSRGKYYPCENGVSGGACIPVGGQVAARTQSGTSSERSTSPNVPELRGMPSTCGNNQCDGDYDLKFCPTECSQGDAVCGDGKCNGSETFQTCPQDCPMGAYCGDKLCNGDETKQSCPQDCSFSAGGGNGWNNPSETPVSIITASLPDGDIGTSYSYQLEATGGKVPYTWSISNGNLPYGITLSRQIGILSGSQDKEGSYTFTVKVTDKLGNTDTQEFTLNFQKSSFKIVTTSIPNAYVDSPYQAVIEATGGDVRTIRWRIPDLRGKLNPTVGWSHTSGRKIVVGADWSKDPLKSSYVGDYVWDVEVAYWDSVTGNIVETVRASFPFTIRAGSDPTNCTLPWGGTIGGGQSVKAYWESNSINDTCEGNSEMRLCTNGVLMGSYQYQTCTHAPEDGGPIVIYPIDMTLPAGTVGSLYNASIKIFGGQGDYKCSLTSGAVPAGLQLNENCTITGTPKEEGLGWSTFGIRVKDSKVPYPNTLTKDGLRLLINTPDICDHTPPTVNISAVVNGNVATVTGTASDEKSGIFEIVLYMSKYYNSSSTNYFGYGPNEFLNIPGTGNPCMGKTTCTVTVDLTNDVQQYGVSKFMVYAEAMDNASCDGGFRYTRNSGRSDTKEYVLSSGESSQEKPITQTPPTSSSTQTSTTTSQTSSSTATKGTTEEKVDASATSVTTQSSASSTATATATKPAQVLAPSTTTTETPTTTTSVKAEPTSTTKVESIDAVKQPTTIPITTPPIKAEGIDEVKPTATAAPTTAFATKTERVYESKSATTATSSTSGISTTVPSAPNISAITQGGKVILSWTVESSIANSILSYQLQRATQNTSVWTSLGSVSGQSHIDMPPITSASGTNYSYRVRAKNSNGYGEWSPIKNVVITSFDLVPVFNR